MEPKVRDVPRSPFSRASPREAHLSQAGLTQPLSSQAPVLAQPVRSGTGKRLRVRVRLRLPLLTPQHTSHLVDWRPENEADEQKREKGDRVKTGDPAPF